MSEIWKETDLETRSLSLRSISWSAIFSGVIVAFLVHLLLTLVGTAIGTSTIINAHHDQYSWQNLGIGTIIWSSLNILITISVGAYTAGSIAKRQGMLHGVLMFGISTMITLWLAITLASSLMNGAFNILGSTIHALNQGIVFSSAHSNNHEIKKNVQQKIINHSDKQYQKIINPFKKLEKAVKTQVQTSSADEAAQTATKASWYVLFMLLLGMVLSAMFGRLGEHNFSYNLKNN